MPATIDPPMRKAKKPQPAKRTKDKANKPSPNSGARMPPPPSACRCIGCINRINAARICCTKTNSGKEMLGPEEPSDAHCRMNVIGPHASSDTILSAAPTDLNSLSGFMFHLTNTQLRRSWKPLLVNALMEELDATGDLYRKRGTLRFLHQCIDVVHSRFIRLDRQCLDPNKRRNSR